MNTAPSSHSRISAPGIILLASILLCAGCGEAGGDQPTTPPVQPPIEPPIHIIPGDVTFTGVTVRGSLPDPATVTVRGVTDDDGRADQDFAVAFTLDGGTGLRSLPVDPGLDQSWNATLPIVISPATGSAITIPLTLSTTP